LLEFETSLGYIAKPHFKKIKKNLAPSLSETPSVGHFAQYLTHRKCCIGLAYLLLAMTN
jgi:hypothetical protein